MDPANGVWGLGHSPGAVGFIHTEAGQQGDLVGEGDAVAAAAAKS